jgi:hypothetical protein
MAKKVQIRILVEPEEKADFLATCCQSGFNGRDVFYLVMHTVADSARDPDAFRVQLAADAAKPAQPYTRERIKQTVRATVAELFKAAPRQRRYTLADLLAESDYSQPQTTEDREWLDAPAVGRELI